MVLMYYQERININTKTDHFFLTTNYKPIALRTFNMWLKPALKELNLPSTISIQYFRWSINNNRKDITKTPNGICEILLGHAPSSTNEKFYTGNLTPEKRATLYDNNNPYRTVKI